MVGICIIGCGKITQLRHAPEYLENPGAHIVGFFDMDAKRAEATAAKFGGRVYDSIEQMLADKDIDAVSVNVANVAHAEVSIAALEAGKHVLCEKPMAVTRDECEAMVAAARKAGKRLLIGHNQRLANAHVHARQMIAQGLIGRPLSFRTVFGHPGPECWTGKPDSWFLSKAAAHFGVLGDLGIHKTDLIHYLLDEPIVQVSAVLRTMDKRYTTGELVDVEDNALCLYETRSGVPGSMQVSWTFYAGEDNSTLIWGTKGLLRLYDDLEYSLIWEPNQGDAEHHRLDELTTNEDQNAGNRTNTGVIDEFIAAITEGRPSVLDGEQALRAMRVVFAAEESARTGQRGDVAQDV